MITVTVPPESLGRVRLTYSPLWELAASLYVLLHEPHSQLHQPWIKWAMARVDLDLLDLLSGLMPSPHRWPDFASPTPGAPPQSLRTELATLAETELDVIYAELELCWHGRPRGRLGAIFDRGQDVMGQLKKALECYWKMVLAPVWPRLRGVLTADLAFRADDLARGGLRALLSGLHPSVRFDGHALTVASSYHTLTRDAGSSGMVLLPLAFEWPRVGVMVTEPYPVTLSYAPRGAGTLWQSRKAAATPVTARLIGASRAAILALLDSPLNTTQIAELADLSLPAVSQHLSVLRANGLIVSRKSGRTQWNSRTSLGRALLDAAEDPDSSDERTDKDDGSVANDG